MLADKGKVWIPKHTIEYGDHFAHDGGEANLGRFTGGEEGVIFGLHVRVEADCDEGWHVEGLAEVSASGADAALGAVLS